MMEKLKSLDFEICFDSNFSFAPLKVKFNSQIINLKKGKTFLTIIVSSIDQNIDMEFQGYVPEDKHQKIIVELYYKKVKLDTTVLCSFQMINNLYVDNTILKDYNEIHFNGILTLKFFKSWFECNILNGAYITNEKRFLNRWVLDYKQRDLRIDKDKKNYDIMCFGCSYTYGEGVENQSTWPYLLGERLNLSIGNFGVKGMSIHGCLRQLLFCLENYTADKVIILLPNHERILYRFKFLDNSAFYNFNVNLSENMINHFINYKKKLKYTLEKGHKNGERIINYFYKLKTKFYITSWDPSVYASIPDGKEKLPQFPSLHTFSERATDGSHPHEKHYKLFVSKILPYIQ